jgi:euchromatic histone-lysine N-methyltransferase
MLALTPELCDALQKELDPSPDDDAYFANCLRRSQLHLQAIAASLRRPSFPTAAAAAARPPPIPPPLPPRQELQQQMPQQDPGAGGSTKKRARAVAEVVRVSNLGPADQLHYRALVRRARLTFEALRAAYQRQEPSVGARNRADLRASSRMLSAGHWLHREVRIVGDIPGVLVGDAFYYRAELCVVGLHTAPQAGIGYIPASLVDEGHPVATSIVSSGGYLDDEDTGDVLVYTGSGGRQRNRIDHHADQTLERGNLALHNSYLYGVEVRVVRGHICELGPNTQRKFYVYDGLYRVVSSTFGPGKSGHDVCKFKLVRLPGQDELGSKSWHTAKQLKDAMDARIRPPKYISLDLSKGTEVLRVPVCNKLDDDRSPLHFEYTVRPEFPVPPAPGPGKRQRGCHCAMDCVSKCRCQGKNAGGQVYTADGTLVLGRPVVYECGALCGCPMTCVNRVTQRGMKHRLEVFRSPETGWGVRALDMIPPGAFVCEYSGDVVVMDDHSGKALMGDRCIIDPKRFPARWKEWGDASAVDPSKRVPQFAEFAGPGYVLDVSRKRNVACYISHSCTPNVFLQFVVRGNEDEHFPRLMVFAMETIPPMRELSIDYGIDA